MKRWTAFPLLCLVAAPACTELEPMEPLPGASFGVTGAAGPVVMTRNIYFGGDISPILAVSDPQQIPLVAAAIWAEIQASDFPLRAHALADEIVQSGAHLVGLQEVALYRSRSLLEPAPATEVEYDFLQMLLDALAARGTDYRVVASASGTDVELPVWTGAPAPPAGPVRFVRLTDRDVILARADVVTSNADGGTFSAALSVPVGGPGGAVIDLRRAWTSVDVMAAGHTFRFINTHLEVQGFAPVQVAQAQELISRAASSPLPVVMVGDFNSDADGSQTPTYGMITAAGFRDVWNRNGSPGYTCCQHKELRNRHSELDQRLDIIFIRGFDTSHFTAGGLPRIVGDKVGDRMRWGIWPSDHAGVVASLRLPPPGAH